MNSRHRMLSCFLTFLLLSSSLMAQQTIAPESAVVPRLVNFSGKALDAQGKVVSGPAGVTFAIYREESGGSALWIETQNVQADAKGNYTVQLGATKSEGLPLDLFTSGEARWLGVTVNNGEEQPRILLLSVPYALKAADAETVGGLPASAFALATPAVTGHSSSSSTAASANPNPASSTARTSSDVTTSGGTVNALPLFSTGTNIQNSIVTQTGTTAVNVAGKFNLPATGTASATAGKNSQPETFVASAFNKTTNAAAVQTFQLQAEPAGNDTTSAGATLNLLYGSGTAAPAETGLKIGQRGLITFAAGQTFPTVTGTETVTGDLTASELVSTVATGTAPLKVNSTTQVANLNASFLGGAPASAFANLGSNSFLASQSISGGLFVTSPGNPGGPIARLGSNGAMDSDSVQIYSNGGAYLAETFVAGCAGCFVPGAQVGDGGMRVSPGQNLVLGDAGLTRMNLDSAGNASQPLAAGGFVKAMVYVNAYTTPYNIVSCFNSTLTGAAATTPPCGINFTEDEIGAGFWDFDFGFDLDNRFFSVTSTVPWICAGAYPLSSNTVQVVTTSCNNSSQGAKFYLFVY